METPPHTNEYSAGAERNSGDKKKYTARFMRLEETLV